MSTDTGWENQGEDEIIGEIVPVEKRVSRGQVSRFNNKILDNMPPPLTDDDAGLYLKAIIYGDFGTGKSTMSYRFGRTMVLAADPGWVVKQNWPELDVEVQEYVGFRQLEAYADAYYVQDKRVAEFDTLVIDTIPEVQEDYIDLIVRASDPPRAETRNRFTMKSGEGIPQVTLPELPGFDDYHAAKNILRPSFRTLNKAPVNVIYIAHERLPNEMAGKKTSSRDRSIRPNLTESCFSVLAKQVHTIGVTEVVDDQYTICFRNGYERRVAKSRIGELNGKTILQDDFPKYIERWQGRKYANHRPV